MSDEVVAARQQVMECERYANKLECALERVRCAAKLVLDDDVRDLIQSLTFVKDDRKA